MNKFRKTLHILSWIPIGLIKVILMILGYLVVPFMLKYGNPETFPIWGNREGMPESFDKSEYNWYTTQNPVNNLRFIFKEPKLEDIQFETNYEHEVGTYPNFNSLDLLDQPIIFRWAFSGPYAGYRVIWVSEPGKYNEWWFGWKVGSPVSGMGFTGQRARNRMIGR